MVVDAGGYGASDGGESGDNVSDESAGDDGNNIMVVMTVLVVVTEWKQWYLVGSYRSWR